MSEIVATFRRSRFSTSGSWSAALDRDAAARRFPDGLSYSNRLRIVLSIDGAKTSETRERRIDKAVSALREGRT